MQNGERSILIVVPRTGQDACRSLSHTFADDSTVEVIVDRRFKDRCAGNGAYRPDRRRGDRRIRLAGDAAQERRRSTAVPPPPRSIQPERSYAQARPLPRWMPHTLALS